MDGGRLYGEGMFGTAFDAKCKIRDSKTLCRILKSKPISSIRLFSFAKSIEVDPIEFIKYVSRLDCCIAKMFKGYMIGIDEKHFHDELKSMELVYEIFGKKTSDMTTLTMLSFDNFSFSGMRIHFENGKKLYLIFSTRCDSDLSHKTLRSLDVLEKDILVTLFKMQEQNFAHYDIKLDNIIYCSNVKKFKLIDWGLAQKITPKTFQFANPMCNTPLTYYITGAPAFASIRIFYYSNWNKNRDWWNSAMFQEELYPLIAKEFREAIQSPKAKLLELYGKKLDIFALGICLAQLVHANKLNWKKYRPFVLDLISMNGSLNAKDALKFYNAH